MPENTDNPNIQSKIFEIFPNIIAVLAYLEGSGWKIKQAKLYRDRNAHKLRQRRGGGFTLDEVNRYAAECLQRADGDGNSPAPSPENSLQTQKVTEDTRRARAQADLLETKTKILKEKWRPGDWADNELLKRLAIFRSELENFARSTPQDIIALVGGDFSRVPELTEYEMNAFAGILARYSQPVEYDVPVYSPPGDMDSILSDDISSTEAPV